MPPPMDGSTPPRFGRLADALQGELPDLRVPGSSSTHFHLHINCFTKTLPPSIEAYRQAGVLTVTRFDHKGLGPDQTLWIATRKVPTGADADNWFEKISITLDGDEQMLGYMESEAVRTDNIMRFAPRPFSADPPFPLERWSPCRADRRADIHVFRDAQAPRDVLDSYLHQVGFYEVGNAEERIWTLLLGDRDEAAFAFTLLKDYLAEAGGASKIELELVRKLAPFPQTYTFAPVYFRGP